MPENMRVLSTSITAEEMKPVANMARFYEIGLNDPA